MFSRRQFLGQISVAGGLIGIGSSPISLAANAVADQPADAADRALVVVFLRGGNDGLNTVVPLNDPLYRRHRPDIGISKAEAISLDPDTGLHPSLRGLAKNWENGEIAIVRGVGYPKHNRSHFVSTAVWHSARPGSRPGNHDGWLGRALDPLQAQCKHPLAFSAGVPATPAPLQGRRTRTAVPPDVPAEEAEPLAGLLASQPASETANEQERYVQRCRADAAEALRELTATNKKRTDDFPNSDLGRNLSQVAWLLSRQIPARVFYVEHGATSGVGGYDTHAAQGSTHSFLLRDLGESLQSFQHHLKDSGNQDRVTVLVFSEFGRRVAENASGGTDHGKAGPSFLLGGSVRGGLYGQAPDLEHLADGDVAVTTDFRDVYASLLQDVLGINAEAILGNGFKHLPLLHAEQAVS